MKLFIVLLMLCASLLMAGCTKFLDAKSDQRLVVPSTATDLQSLLDNYVRSNQREPTAGERSADDFYLTTTDWEGLDEFERRTYLWEPDRLFARGGFNDWSNVYDNVYRANVVLDNINNVSRDTFNSRELDDIKGQALFLRAKSLFIAATIWSPVYKTANASLPLGIPLRLNSDFNEKSTRSTLEATYKRIQDDLIESARLLSEKPVHILRASKAAAYAMLSRVSLYMGNYQDAVTYAKNSLAIKDTLLDYNSTGLNSAATYPFAPRYSHPEIIMDNSFIGTSTLLSTTAKIDSSLYASYSSADLRKLFYFRTNNNGSFRFKGSYEGQASLFSGIATDEVWLILAESLVRTERLNEGLQALNRLMSKRYRKTEFLEFQTTNTDTALTKILSERRKELCLRGLRWIDIKRLNREGQMIKLQRIINGQLIELEPNDLRFALAIPEDVIDISGMAQNPR